MYRRLSTWLRSRIAAVCGARTGSSVSWTRHLWQLLAWPAGALLVLGLGWLVLFQQLEGRRQQLELKALQDAQTLANGYAEQVKAAVDVLEQSARFVEYDWESRQVRSTWARRPSADCFSTRRACSCRWSMRRAGC